MEMKILPVLVLGAVMLNQVFWMSNYAHLLQALHPVYLISFYLVWILAGSSRNYFSIFLRTGAFLFGGLFVFYNLFICMDPGSGTFMLKNLMTEPLTAPPATGLKYLEDKTKSINSVEEYITSRTHPDDPLFVFPQLSLLYFLTERKNPTRFDYFEFVSLNYDIGSRETSEEILRDILDSETRYIVYSEPPSFLDTERPLKHRFSFYMEDLFRPLTENFTPVAVFGEFIIMKKYRSKDGGSLEFCLGLDDMKHGDLEKAAGRLESAIEKGVTPVNAFRTLGDCYYGLGDEESALETYTKFLQENEVDGDLSFRLGNIYAGLENWSRAEEWYRKSVVFERSQGRLLKLAYSLKQTGRLEESLKLTRRLEEQAPRDPDVLLLKGNILYRIGLAEEALQPLIRYREMRDDDAKGLSLLASSYVVLGQWSEALDLFETLLVSDPGDVKLIAQYAAALRQMGKSGEASSILEDMVTDPGKPDKYWYQLGLAYFDSGFWMKAAGALRRHISKFPGDINALTKLASALASSGNGEEALQLLENAFEEFPSSNEIKIALARQLVEYGETTRAEVLALSIPPEDEEYLEALELIAVLRYRAGDLESSRRNSLESLYIDPRNRIALSRMAMISKLERDCPSEGIYLDKALDLDPYSEEIHLKIIDHAMRCVSPDAAMEKAFNAASLLPGSKEIALKHAEVALFYGDPARSKDLLIKSGASGDEALLLESRIDLATGETGADEGFMRYIEKYPDRVDGYMGAARAAFFAGESGKAVDILLKGLEQCSSGGYSLLSFLADIQKSEGRTGEATFYLLLALQKSPNIPDSLNTIGYKLLDAGLPLEGIKAFRRAGETSSPVSAFGIAEGYYKAGMVEDALKHYDTVQGKFPDSWQALQSKGMNALIAGSKKEARDLFHKAFRNSGESESSSILLARSLLLSGYEEDAVSALVTGGKQAACSEEIHLFLSTQHLKMGNPLDAVDLLSRFSAECGGSRRVLEQLVMSAWTAGDNDLASYYLDLIPGIGKGGAGDKIAEFIANWQISSGEYEKAAGTLANLVATSPYRTDLSRKYAESLMRSGQEEEAIRVFKKILDEDRSDESSILSLSELMPPGEAVYLMEGYLRENPESASIRKKLGNILIEHDKIERGIGILLYGHEREETDPELILLLAVAYRSIGSFERSAIFFDEALEYFGQSVIVLNDAAAIFAELGLVSRSLDLLSRAIDIDPDDVETGVSYAEYMALGGNPDKAVETLRKLIASNPGDERPRAGIIKILTDSYRIEEALKEWDRLENKDPAYLASMLQKFDQPGDRDALLTFIDNYGGLLAADDGWNEMILDLYLANGELERANTHIDTIARDSNLHETSFRRGKLRLEEGNPSKAVTELLYSLELEPDPKVSSLLIDAYLAVDMETALNYSRRMNRFYPDNDLIAVGYLKSLLANGKYKNVHRPAR